MAESSQPLLSLTDFVACFLAGHSAFSVKSLLKNMSFFAKNSILKSSLVFIWYIIFSRRIWLCF